MNHLVQEVTTVSFEFADIDSAKNEFVSAWYVNPIFQCLRYTVERQVFSTMQGRLVNLGSWYITIIWWYWSNPCRLISKRIKVWSQSERCAKAMRIDGCSVRLNRGDEYRLMRSYIDALEAHDAGRMEDKSKAHYLILWIRLCKFCIYGCDHRQSLMFRLQMSKGYIIFTCTVGTWRIKVQKFL